MSRKVFFSFILLIFIATGPTITNIDLRDSSLMASSVLAASTQIWEKYIGSQVYNPPAIADIDNDTIAEFVFGATDGIIYALNSEDGSTLWSYDTECDLQLSPQVADIDQDNLLEVIVEGEPFTPIDNDTFVFNGEDGSIVWADSTVMDNGIILTDPDSNKDWEIIHCDGYTITVYSAENGSFICSDTVTENIKGIDVFNVTADDKLEIVTIGLELNNNVLRVYEYDNQSLNLLNITYIDTSYGEFRYLEYADVTNDTVPEYILSGYNDLAVFENGTYSRLWNHQWTPGSEILIATPSIGDLDGDSTPEIVVGYWETVYAFNGETGSILWTQHVYNQISSQEIPLPLADFDNDDKLEVLVASEDNNVYVLDGEDGWFIWSQTIGASMLKPLLFDVAGDSVPEVVGWNYNQYFYVFTVEEVVRITLTTTTTGGTSPTSTTTSGGTLPDMGFLLPIAGTSAAILPILALVYLKKRRPSLVLSEDEVEEDELIDYAQPVVVKGLQALRGGEMIGNKFRFKTKLVNTSKFVITEINVSILSYPRESLKLDGDVTRLYSKIDPNGFRSPGFEFLPTQDCVQGEIVASISFMDYQGNAHSMTTKPYTVRAVCDLLTPESISPDDFALKLSSLEQGDTVLQVKDWTPEEMTQKTSAILRSSNFHEVSTSQSKIGENLEIRVNGWASGKYTGKKIGVEVTITGKSHERGSKCKVVVSGEEEAMILPAIDEISQKLGAWLCPRCSGALPKDSVKELKAGNSVSCPFCSVTIDR